MSPCPPGLSGPCVLIHGIGVTTVASTVRYGGDELEVALGAWLSAAPATTRVLSHLPGSGDRSMPLAPPGPVTLGGFSGPGRLRQAVC